MSAPVKERIAWSDQHDESPAGAIDMQVILGALQYWWKFAVPVAVVLSLLAVGLVLLFAKPKYTASTWLIIREKPEYLLNPHVMEDPRKFVLNQMELLRSPPVIDPVANKPEVFAAPELASGDPAERLRRLLKVRAQGQSDFFVIEFTSEIPEKAALVVNEVANNYLLLQDRDLSKRMEATITRLEKQRADQQQLIERLRDQVQEKTKTLTGVDPYATKSPGTQIGIQDSLSPLQGQIVDAEIEHAMMAAQVGAEEELLKKQAFDVSAAEVESRIQSLPEVEQRRRRIAEAHAMIQEHERTSANVSKNQAYQLLVKQKAADEAQLEKRMAELRKLVKADLEKSARLKRTDEVAAMRKSLDAKRLAVDILRERMQKERANQQVYKGETVELEFLRTDYESAAKVFEAINERIVSMRLEQHAPERVMLFKEATVPTVPDQALPFKHMSLAGALAFALPFGLAIGFELLHRRVSNRRQLESTSRMPVVAEVTSLPRAARNAGLISGEHANRELQLFEESIYSLRTHLLLSESSIPLRTLAVTSAISREGKTSVAVQLAMSIARSTGEPTLLIDGDLRCPDIHRIFEIDRSPGLAELLTGTTTPAAAIERAYSPSLHLLPAGRLSTVPHRLLGGSAFPSLLAQLQEKYRYIVIDTPPILPASEALILARAADATVVCARQDFSRLDQVTEAYGRLRSAGVAVAGTVLNGISPSSYAYRYGSYYYDREDGEATAEVVPTSTVN
jgi:succinoglycan biosynthesis transport protein ExoP